MKKTVLFLLFAIVVCTTYSFVPSHIVSIRKMPAPAEGKHYYFRVSDGSSGNYYFSNVIWIEDTGSGTYSPMMKQKERFKQFLKKDFALEWPLSNITSYEFKDKESADADRKTRIKQAGDHVRNIDL